MNAKQFYDVVREVASCRSLLGVPEFSQALLLQFRLLRRVLRRVACFGGKGVNSRFVHDKQWLFQIRMPLWGFLLAGLVPLQVQAAETSCPQLLNHTFPRLQDEKQQSLCDWKGKVILVVNTASYCGFTDQYDGLEKLYARLRDKGLVVVGFPTNDFGGQEPGSNKEIADFCRTTYSIQFPMFAKSSVRGAQMNPFYRQLVETSGAAPKWNFHKYLIDRQGREVVAFSSATEPDDKKMLAQIEAFLAR